MKLPAQKLAAQVVRSLAPLYVLCGDEPLLIDEALALIRERAQRDGGCEREALVADRGFDWDGFAAGLQNLSLFAGRRLVELRLPSGKPGEAGARILGSLAARPDTGNVVVLVLPALDKAGAQSKWAAALAAAAIWVEPRAPRRADLPAWLRERLRQAGLDATDAALDVLASRVEGNLLAARQEVDKLALLMPGATVTAEAIRDAVADGARFDVFQLVEAALAGDAGRALRVLNGLEREGESEVLITWTLAREIANLSDVVARVRQGRSIDQALQEAGVWRSRAEVMRQAARAWSTGDVGRLLRGAARLDQIVKGARPGEPWKALSELVLMLVGSPALSAELA